MRDYDVITYPVTHRWARKNGKITKKLYRSEERFHWRVDIGPGFSFDGSGPNLMGWKTRGGAYNAGLKTMRNYFALNGRSES